MKDETYSINEIFIALCSVPKMVNSLSGKGKRYEALLNEVLKIVTNHNEDSPPFPSGKELQQRTGLNAQKFKTQLVEIYTDLLSLIRTEDSHLNIANYKFEFYVHYFDMKALFYCSLPVIPRVGEFLRLPFLQPIFRKDNFQVEMITYNLREDCQLIEIWLNGVEQNTYEIFITDKAKYENRYDYRKGKIR